MNPPTKEQILQYEISASWWACFVSTPWLQSLAARYFAWKVNRKYSRFHSVPATDMTVTKSHFPPEIFSVLNRFTIDFEGRILEWNSAKDEWEKTGWKCKVKV